jgi:hypothetical protein
MDLVVFNDNVAFRFDYTATAYFSIIMDRNGEFLEMEENGANFDFNDSSPNDDDSLLDSDFIREKISQLADTIADGIDKETIARLIEINSHAKLNGRLDFLGARFIVNQNKPAYNLIYQGEIELSFLLDERGRFLDYADPHANENDISYVSKSLETDPSHRKEMFIEENELEEHDIAELIEDAQLETIDDEEMDSIDNLLADENEDLDEKRDAMR